VNIIGYSKYPSIKRPDAAKPVYGGRVTTFPDYAGDACVGEIEHRTHSLSRQSLDPPAPAAKDGTILDHN